MFFFFMCLFVCVCVLLEIVQFKSIQMIDSDSWPWLVCLTDPCCAEGDMITFFSRLLAMRNASMRPFNRMAGLDEWLIG